MPEAEVGVLGGSGFYAFLEDVDEVELETPYGKPSARRLDIVFLEIRVLLILDSVI